MRRVLTSAVALATGLVLATAVQGAGADGAKNALALLWETRERCPSAAPVLFVHDEIVVECEAADAEQTEAWLVECMERGMSEILTKVPVVVDSKVVADWSGTPTSATAEAR